MKKSLLFLSLLFSSTLFADTETINWYKDGSVYDTTTCQTGDYISFPTQPTKRGHNFVGWQVALYDFSTLDASIDSDIYTSNKQNLTWAVTFNYGRVSGISLCSETLGIRAQTGVPDESGFGETRYCWCKVTGYIPNGSILHENISQVMWVYNHDGDSVSGCTNRCTGNCAKVISDNADFRRAAFGITQ